VKERVKFLTQGFPFVKAKPHGGSMLFSIKSKIAGGRRGRVETTY
jgi:hypothetical protein